MAGQSRQPIFQLCKLDLKLAFFRAGPAREDIENQARTIDNLGIERLLEILRLAGRQLVIENDEIDAFLHDLLAQFFDLALTYKRCRVGTIATLDHLVDDACAGRGGQLTQLIESVRTNQYCILHLLYVATPGCVPLQPPGVAALGVEAAPKTDATARTGG